MFAFRYHGNYVGPGWSAGRYQPSVAYSNVPAIDEFDETARKHDRAYALKNRLKRADYQFYKENIGKGFKRSLAALAVGAQGFLRKPEISRFGFKKQFFSSKEKNKMPPVKRRLSFGSISSGGPPSKRSSPYRVTKFTPQRKMLMKQRQRVALRVLRKRPVNYTTGRISTRIRKHRKSGKAGKLRERFEKKGIVKATEYAATYNGSTLQQTIAIGHGTFITRYFRQLAIAAVLRKLFNKAGLQVGSWNDTLGSLNFGVGDLIEFTGVRDTNVLGDNIYSLSYTLIAGDLTGTFENLVDKIDNQFVIVYRANSSGDLTISWQQVSFFPVGAGTKTFVARTQMLISGAKCEFLCNSQMKVQNQTVAVETDNQADNVNNVPIMGRSYEGLGTGLVRRGAFTASSIAGGAVYAINWKTGHISDNGISKIADEPWTKVPFVGVSKTIGVRYQPGEIRTSTLQSRMFVPFDDIMKQVVLTDNTGLQLTNPLIKRGKFRVQLLEKMIGLAGATGVKVAFEVNNYMGVIFKPGRAGYMQPTFETTTP